MVSLSKLTVHGFKSFKNKVSLDIGPGITCIAGANGSGKSNIVDAFSFVLGRSSAKFMRADKMEDVIFKSDRGAASFAKVELEFDNSDRVIKLDSDVVTIFRQINSDGQSTYRLNGKIDTRQRILDLLREARITPEGLNIVAQGDVTRVIEMTPGERRKVIDDLAGLAEFDEKKKKSESELEKVSSILTQQSLLLAEKERLFSNISEEKRKVETYEELNGKVKRMKFTISKKKLDDGVEKKDQISGKCSEIESKLSEALKEVQEFDAKMEEIDSNLKNMAKNVLGGSKEVAVIEKQEKVKSQLMTKEARIKNNEREITRLRQFIERLDEVDKPKAVKFLLGKPGVLGTPDQVIGCSPENREAIDAALGGAKNNIIVDSVSTADSLIRYLKENKIGTAKFLPLDKIRGNVVSRPRAEGVVDVAINLVKYEPKYNSVAEFLLGSTVVMGSLASAKALINQYRLVTQDGSLIEKSGAILGGYKDSPMDSSRYLREISALEQENKTLSEELELLRAELEKTTKSRDEVKGEYSGLSQRMEEGEAARKELSEKRRKVYERKLRLESDLSSERVKLARIETELKLSQDELSGLELFEELEKGSVNELKDRISQYTREMSELGPLNMKSVEDFDTYRMEYENLKEKVEKIVEEKYAIEKVILEIETHRKDAFMALFNEVDVHFREIYTKLSEGEGYLSLEEEGNVYSGLLIKAKPKGKRLLGIDSLSGGEKTVTAIAFLLSIQRCKPSCFCLLDEIDAALDKENTRKIVDLIQEFTSEQQYLIVTHNEVTISKSNQVYGVISEGGVSTVVGIKLNRREENLTEHI
ncbi:MAG: chromosome segregation protein SMC [Candidatus Aenigmarchaeota archaeon]|nr:chromosome segregation protein SMC [Candidatus Aenigmarchaeota archaeon]